MDNEIERNHTGLTDSWGRTINYMRLSVTDRCNLRCIYCNPPEKIKYLDRSEICSYGELLQIARVASLLGIDKIRLTGGELFLRKDIIEFIHSLQKLSSIREIALTTNGTRLLPHLKRLKEIGIKRINISLDTLSEDLFFRITGSHEYSSILNGIHQALDQDFRIKINMVVLKGVNEAEIPEFARYFLRSGAVVMFIEFMPLCGLGWNEKYFFPYEKIKDSLSRKFDLHPLPFSGVAREFAISDGNGLNGQIGIIAPLSACFCSFCSRIRLSASGELRPCLFSRSKVELMPLLRGNFTPGEKEGKIREAFKKAVQMKPLCMPKTHGVSDVYIRTLGG